MQNLGVSPIRPSTFRVVIEAIILAIMILLLLLKPWELKEFSCAIKFPVREKASNGIFMDHQVIVMGPQKEVDAAIEQVQGDLGVKLVIQDDCSLSYLTDRTLISADAPPVSVTGKEPATTLFSNPALTDEQQGSIVMRLYYLQSKQAPLEDVIAEINAIGRKGLEFQLVSAGPNYLTDALDDPTGSCGNPFSGGGSPFSGGGSSYASYAISSNTSISQFVNQWAFQNNRAGIGTISIPSAAGNTTSSDRVRVGIFDTAPWNSTGITKTVTLPGTQPASAFSIKVTNALTAQPTVNNSPNYDISSHGLFVAALVNAISPNSEIHLIRVLNKQGCGDVWMISKAIQRFISRMSSNKEDPSLHKVVVSLSLGAHKPDAAYKALHPEVNWTKLDTALASLEEAVGDAYDLGAIVVAAAGNDSAGSTTVAPAQLPAGYEEVIAVSASNGLAGWSCYSNAGDVAAPGGDGGEGTGAQGTLPCVARASSWFASPGPNGGPRCNNTVNGMTNCSFGVISLVKDTGSGDIKYALWVGSSFSTPLVSGLAAQALDAMQGDQQKAICAIREGASRTSLGAAGLDWGIINMNNSLSSNVINNCNTPLE